MAYYNKFKNVDIALPNVSSGLNGEFKISAFKGYKFGGKVYEYPGTRRLLQDWHPNLIVNNGLDAYGAGGSAYMDEYCYVGTGNTPPTNTDSSMESYVAQDADNSRTPTAQGSAPYFGKTETKYLFSPNFGGGDINLNEIGVGRTSDHTTGLTSRSLTVNGSGVPTTISVLAEEYLECYYRRRNYPGHIVEATGAPTDDTGTVTIEGISYGYTIRPSMVTVGGSYSVGTGAGWGTCMRIMDAEIGYSNNVFNEALGYKSDAALGSVTGGPTGTGFGDSPQTTYRGTYTTGSYSMEIGYEFGISDLNDAGGIKALLLKTSLGAYQMLFDTVIPKVYGQVFTFYHNFSWARKLTWV